MSDPNAWPERPKGAEGEQVRSLSTFEVAGVPTRVGHANFTEILVETAEWVVFRSWTSDGQDVCPEQAMQAATFNARYERRPSRVDELLDALAATLNELEVLGLNPRAESGPCRLQLNRGSVFWNDRQQEWEVER